MVTILEPIEPSFAFQARDGTTFSFQPRSINLPAFQRQSALIWHDGPMRELVRESGGYNCAGLVFVGRRSGLEPTVKGQAVGRKISDRQCSRCSLLTGIAVELAPRHQGGIPHIEAAGSPLASPDRCSHSFAPTPRSGLFAPPGAALRPRSLSHGRSPLGAPPASLSSQSTAAPSTPASGQELPFPTSCPFPSPTQIVLSLTHPRKTLNRTRTIRFRPYTPIYFDRVLGDSGSPHLTHPADGRTRYTWKWRRWPATGQLSKATSRPLVLNVA